MKQYFSLPMIWYYCLMERKMIYDDFHSFMLFYFLCLLLTHLILFHIFPLLLERREKIAFLSFSSSSTTFLHAHEEINIRGKQIFAVMRKQRSIKITFMKKSHFVNFFRIIYMKSKNFPKSCNFPQQSIIISQRMNEWNSSLYPALWR